MRGMMLVAALAVTACARPGFNYNPAHGVPLSITSSPNPSYVDAQRIAAAKDLNLHIVTKDGVRLFCRSEFITGSHIVRDTTCYTAEQIEQMDERTQRDLKFFLMPNLPIQHP